MTRMAIGIAIAFACLMLGQGAALQALAASPPHDCCCTQSCTTPMDFHPTPSHCGCTVVCAPLPLAALPSSTNFWSGSLKPNGMSFLFDVASPETRRTKPLLPPPKFTV